MNQARKIGIYAVLLLIAGATLLALRVPRGGGPSAFSPGPSGWLAARKYLTARSAQITFLDHQLGEEKTDPKASTSQRNSVLVTGFPWSSGILDSDFEPYRDFAQAGGTVVVAYSGQIPRGVEKKFWTFFGLTANRARRRSPWGYRGWRRWQTEIWQLVPNSALCGQVPSIALLPPAAAPQAPDEARPWFHAAPGTTAGSTESQEKTKDSKNLADEVLEEQGSYLSQPLADGAPVIFSLPIGEGRMIWLPADVLSNARLGAAGNAALLESLLAAGATHWNFDEYHHGLRPPGERVSPVPQRVFDLFLLHLLALYLLAVWFLARRFGPVWGEPTAHSGSAGGFLRGMGLLHEEMGHHRSAGKLLVERVQQLDTANPAFASALANLEPATSGPRLVQLAHRVATLRREHGALPPINPDPPPSS